MYTGQGINRLTSDGEWGMRIAPDGVNVPIYSIINENEERYRQDSEAVRVANENVRIANEQARVNAENEREERINDFFDLYNTILSLIANIEESPSLNAYEADSYLIYNGNLYKVTNSIEVGDDIVPEENITSTTVMNEIAALS